MHNIKHYEIIHPISLSSKRLLLSRCCSKITTSHPPLFLLFCYLLIPINTASLSLHHSFRTPNFFNFNICSLSTPAPSNSLQIIEIPDDEDDNDMSRENIKSITGLKENEKAGYYYTYAKIVNLDCTTGWYYDSCKLCWAKCIKNDKGKWVCTRDRCDGNLNGFTSRIPRYQVKFEVTDPSGDIADFVVFDTQINQFITPTAAEILAKIEKSGGDQEDIPRELEAFLDKSFLFKVNVNEKYNVSQGSYSYTVYSMTDDANLADKWLSKYSEMFKDELRSFKSRTTPLVVAEHSKVLIDISNAEEEEKSQTADNSRITPLKRPRPTDDGDASSTTKNNVVVKKEK